MFSCAPSPVPPTHTKLGKGQALLTILFIKWKLSLVFVVFRASSEGELHWTLRHTKCIQCHWMWGASAVQTMQSHLQYQSPLISLRGAVGVPILRWTWREETWELLLFFWHTYKTNTCSIKNNTALLCSVSLPCVWLKNMPQFRVLCLLRYNITVLQWATSESTAGKLAPIVLKRAAPETFSAATLSLLASRVYFFFSLFLFCCFLESCWFLLWKAVVTQLTLQQLRLRALESRILHFLCTGHRASSMILAPLVVESF